MCRFSTSPYGGRSTPHRSPRNNPGKLLGVASSLELPHDLVWTREQWSIWPSRWLHEVWFPRPCINLTSAQEFICWLTSSYGTLLARSSRCPIVRLPNSASPYVAHVIVCLQCVRCRGLAAIMVALRLLQPSLRRLSVMGSPLPFRPSQMCSFSVQR
jgi:hypothetical protein